MSRDKQIEEMAKDICKFGCVCTCLECEYVKLADDDCACIDVKIAEGLYNAGYRKASDVAEEIFAEIEECMRDFEDDDDGYILKKCEFEFFMRELKKKYTGKDTNVTTNTEN